MGFFKTKPAFAQLDEVWHVRENVKPVEMYAEQFEKGETYFFDRDVIVDGDLDEQMVFSLGKITVKGNVIGMTKSEEFQQMIQNS